MAGARTTVIQTFQGGWGEFPLYILDVHNSVKERWLELAGNLPQSDELAGEQVEVRFTVSADGSLSGAAIEASSGSRLAEMICLDAVGSAGTFDPWPGEMRAALGEAQDMVFTFVY